MLILPLHKKLTGATFPLVTLLLVLANVFVFVFLQGGDAAVETRALSFWRSSGLAALELPAYTTHLRARGDDELAQMLEDLEEPYRSELAFRAVQNDPDFVPRVEDGTALPADHAEHARWRALRGQLAAVWDSSFTQRFLLKYDEVEVKRLFGSMFLHGDFMHLFGNMLFLAFLGLLVEGALGPRAFLGVYLLGGLGGSLLSLLRHYGEAGGALGASGAIAALMGAYCVIWGMRKVRFFYWFFVVFDYVKAPALVLLPAWLGWELANMWLNPGAGIGFDAHAGGIMAGALLAFGVRKLGWERREFLDEDEKRDAEADLRERAMAAFGRLELARARPLLAELAASKPDDLDVLVPLYKSWRPEPARAEFHDAVRRVLAHPSNRAADLARVREAFDDYLAASPGVPMLADAEAIALARRFTNAGATAQAEKLLDLLSKRTPVAEGVAEAWLAYALALHGRRDAGAARVFGEIAKRFPGTKPAEKAVFLAANA